MDGFIDLHHHGRPPAYAEALRKRGITTVGGRTIPSWDRDNTLRMMDRIGIATAVLSAPDAELAFRHLETGLTISRACNEMYAELMSFRPDRFGGLACLPMPHLDESIAEVEYALDTLKLDGVLLSTSYAGRYLGDPGLDPLLQALEARKAVVLVHPITPVGLDQLHLDFQPFLLEFVFDTTRALTNMLARDVPERFPGIRFIFAHAGGTAPFLPSRLPLLETFCRPENGLSIAQARDKFAKGLRGFYYDTALSAVDPVFSMLRDVVGTDRVVFGTDFPQAPPDLVAVTADGVRKSECLNAGERHAIARGNAETLFPRFRAAK